MVNGGGEENNGMDGKQEVSPLYSWSPDRRMEWSGVSVRITDRVVGQVVGEKEQPLSRREMVT